MEAELGTLPCVNLNDFNLKVHSNHGELISYGYWLDFFNVEDSNSKAQR